MELTTEIIAGPSYATEGATEVTFELHNAGTEDVYVLTWGIPLGEC